MNLSGITAWYLRQPRWLQLLLGLGDLLVNIKVGGEAGETISENLAERKKKGEAVGEVGCAILDKADPNHCERADSPNH